MRQYLFLFILCLVVSSGCSPKTGTTMTDKDGVTLVYIPAGKFVMGGDAKDTLQACSQAGLSCSLDWFHDEEPQHTVYLDAFWIDQTEVTNGMYAKCIDAGACDPPGSTQSYGRESYYGDPEFDHFPVIFVSWDQANDYCSWAGRRLPTEAEWEKAARGDDARAYPWGNDLPTNDLLNYKHALPDTTAVGQFPKGASPYGALDMAGNVWEWVADWYSDAYYSESPASNPPGPVSGTERVMRGGAFGSAAFNVRSVFRLVSDPVQTYPWVGFRCATSAAPSK